VRLLTGCCGCSTVERGPAVLRGPQFVGNVNNLLCAICESSSDATTNKYLTTNPSHCLSVTLSLNMDVLEIAKSSKHIT